MKVAKPSHSTDCRLQVRWASSLPTWNGQSVMPPQAPAHMVTSGVSGAWGCVRLRPVVSSEVVGRHQHRSQRNGASRHLHSRLGCSWAKGQVQVRSDKMAVVHALVGGSARDPLLMHLLRCLHLFKASYQIGLQASRGRQGSVKRQGCHLYHSQSRCYACLWHT